MENTVKHYTKRAWVYGGNEYAFDISDSGCMKKMNDALEELREGYAAVEAESHQTHEEIDRVCGMIGKFFKAVFGEDAVVAICGEANNLEAYMGAYVDFIMFVNDQLEALSKFREEIEKRVTEKFASRAASLNCAEAEGA